MVHVHGNVLLEHGALFALLVLQDVKTGCGVMFDVVTGIPKSEGMQRPPKIPANPSFVELDEDENAVEKFKTAMASISNILTLDRLKQVSIYHVSLSSITLAYLCISLHTCIILYFCRSLVRLCIFLHTFV